MIHVIVSSVVLALLSYAAVPGLITAHTSGFRSLLGLLVIFIITHVSLPGRLSVPHLPALLLPLSLDPLELRSAISPHSAHPDFRQLHSNFS